MDNKLFFKPERRRVQGFKDSRVQVEKERGQRSEGRGQRANDSRQPIAVSQKDRGQRRVGGLAKNQTMELFVQR
ncbi:MAG: hypothetical protein ILNGONEN_02022 [Syntrophorhabdaceae bacterium]|nr:hypothetical protein [Syntrophorhabdaceae bacterium]HOG39191.1 hypothetical protein [Syntrophorhabdaceae bacterium]